MKWFGDGGPTIGSWNQMVSWLRRIDQSSRESDTSDKTFVDSNVLISAHDVDADRKYEIAKGLRRDWWLERTGVLSTQVLHESQPSSIGPILRPETHLCGTARRHFANAACRCWQERPDSAPVDWAMGAHALVTPTVVLMDWSRRWRRQ